MQSQQILKMSSSSPNAGMQASAPLVYGIVNHVLLQYGPDLQPVALSTRSRPSLFSVRPDLASLPKFCNGLRSGLFGGYRSGEMNAGVPRCSSLIVSRAVCASALSCCKGRTLVIAPLCRQAPPQRRSGTWRAPSSVAHTCLIPSQP